MTTSEILITITGSSISLLLLIMGYFLRIVHNDIRSNIAETGKLKGRLELVEQKATNDIKHLQEVSQIEIKNMAENISELSKNVNKLVIALAKRNIIDERNQED